LLFPTTQFLIFFCIVFTLHWTLNRFPSVDKLTLLAASWVFYAAWDPRFVFLLMTSATISWTAGVALAHAERQGVRRLVTAAAVTLHLSLLGFFKYFEFLGRTVQAIGLKLGVLVPLPEWDIVLPVGISFFTFQGISYVIDVARRDATPARSPLDVFFYISFFPHLVAGPIVRAAHFLPQLATRPDPARIPVVMASLLILGGLFKKAIVANTIGVNLVDPVFRAPGDQTALDLLMATYGYAVQIYCDFSGYSDIAIGIAALLGYHFPRNFNQPYRAASLSEFWRRWHIALSSFLRDYLYRPLGGNRRGPGRTLVNLLIVMLLGGLWHGAAWTFVLWGAVHGLGLAVERVLGWERPQITGWRRVLAVVIVFHVVCLGWILFRARDLDATADVLSGIATGDWTPDLTTPWIAALIALGLALHFVPGDWMQRLEQRLARWPAWAFGVLVGAVLVALNAIGPEGVAPFIYFQF
jgi:D-alanyl-lipoteichoic acid acyltransferase DltB (MBOAT superfamily)